MAYKPVTDPNADRPYQVPDADPEASVHVRPDRDVYVCDSRHRTSYHLFADCHHLGGTEGVLIEDVSVVWLDALSVCPECERREEVRALLNRGRVPPNPEPDPGILPTDDAPARRPLADESRRSRND